MSLPPLWPFACSCGITGFCSGCGRWILLSSGVSWWGKSLGELCFTQREQLVSMKPWHKWSCASWREISVLTHLSLPGPNREKWLLCLYPQISGVQSPPLLHWPVPTLLHFYLLKLGHDSFCWEPFLACPNLHTVPWQCFGRLLDGTD